MSLLLKVLGGALAGVGKGMVQQAQMDWEEAQKAILYERQVALANLQHKLGLETVAAQGKEQRLTSAQEAKARGQLAEAADARQLQSQVFLKGVDLQNSKQLESFRTSLGMKEAEFKEKLGRATEAIRDHRQIDRIEYVNGNMVVYKKDGTAFTKQGVNPTPRAGESSMSLQDYRSGGDAPAAKPQGQPRTAAADQPDAEFLTRYAHATPETAPRLFRDGKKIPVNEAYQLYRGQ